VELRLVLERERGDPLSGGSGRDLIFWGGGVINKFEEGERTSSEAGVGPMVGGSIAPVEGREKHQLLW